MRLCLVIRSKYTDEPTEIPLFTFDRIHTNGSVTLAPTRIDGKQSCTIPVDHIIGWRMRTWRGFSSVAVKA
jgi:hypothetical protein